MTQAATIDEQRPNGHEQRSSETRSRLIATAIEVFASVGYDAASTRILAKKAKVNLSTIPYHFGGKHELYLAAAEEIADYVRGATRSDLSASRGCVNRVSFGAA